MLGIDHQYGRLEDRQPGADPGVSGRQRRGAVRRAATGGGLRLGPTHPGAARICRPRQAQQGAGASLPGAPDRSEPRPDHAPDRAAGAYRTSERSHVPAAAVSHAIHGLRRQPSGVRRPGARKSERSCHAAHPRTGIQRVQTGGLRAAVGDLSGAPLPTAQHAGLSQAQRQLPADAAGACANRRAAQTATAGRTGFSAHRHGASGGSTRAQRSVSHQCGRRSDAVGGGGGHAADCCG
jgi:hypothetical protein